MTTDALDGIPLYVEFAEEVSIHFEKCSLALIKVYPGDKE